MSLERSVCLWNDSLRSLSQSSLQTQMHPVLAEQWVWIIRQKAVPVTPYLLSPAVPFFLLNFCPNTVTQWSKEKRKQPPVRQKETVINSTTSTPQLFVNCGSFMAIHGAQWPLQRVVRNYYPQIIDGENKAHSAELASPKSHSLWTANLGLNLCKSQATSISDRVAGSYINYTVRIRRIWHC